MKDYNLSGSYLAMFWGLIISSLFVLIALADASPTWFAYAWMLWTIGLFKAVHDSFTALPK